MILSASRLLLLATLAACAARGSQTQASTSVTEVVSAGAGGYTLNFQFQWICDDAPSGTTSAPGKIDLLDGGGRLIASISATIVHGAASVSLQGPGTVVTATPSVAVMGAAGTPAEASLTGIWRISGLAPGTYSMRFWKIEDWLLGLVATTITTQASDAGGGGPIQPPAASLTAASAATAGVPMTYSAFGSMSANGNPLGTVAVDASIDGGATWSPVSSNPRPTNPNDTESGSHAFAQAGSALLRATVTDVGGLQAFAVQAVNVVKAGQPPILLAPMAATVVAGTTVTFSATQGSTGNYSWGGSAAGSGPAQAVRFPTPGTFAVTVFDAGNATFNPSAVVSAQVTVQAAFFTLDVSAGPGGTVSGGGSYAPNTEATVTETPAAGQTFAGWTGDAGGTAQTLVLAMTSNKSVTANFTPLLPQTITFEVPASLPLRSGAFSLVATASSGLPVQIVLDSGPASLTGNSLMPNGVAGNVSLTAAQSGNEQYLPAPAVTVTITITPSPPGAVLLDDGAQTKKTDRETRNTSFRSGPSR